MNGSSGEDHEAFTQWALSKGVEINGIAPARFPGRGMGMVATRTIQENETILMVPPGAMLNRDTIPGPFVSRFPAGASNHSIIAAFLTLGDPEKLKELDPWRKVWPQWKEFEETMPILWPGHLRVSDSEFQDTTSSPSVLPPSASGLWNTIPNESVGDGAKDYQNLLAQQEKRLMCAWNSVVSAFPDADWETFVYHWLIVGSRSFYYVSPGKEPGNWVDALTMVPFADYFNHANDDACEVLFRNQQYTFTANRRYEKGEEIYMSYGPHSNDFLLVEYGFFLDDNPCDAIFLDDIILRDFTQTERNVLASEVTQPTHEHSGGYAVERAGPNLFIRYASSLKFMTREAWKAYVENGSPVSGTEKSTNLLNRWIGVYVQESNIVISIIQSMLHRIQPEADREGEKQKLELLLKRWKQIQQLCQTALDMPKLN
ncbi:hypothetical protein BDV59DRAFT_116587 [Aspergillus ambiguus]|uniref:uncharacterized protein n=1 Tax=Aspergillus ambiguus TaxID=176160 RepID=UPI003CCDDA09